MSKARQRKLEQKRKRRQKRQAKRRSPAYGESTSSPFRFSLDDPRRPDLLKGALGEFVFATRKLHAKMNELEARFQKGVLGFLSAVDHWAMEEFLYHGLPEEDETPIDRFLQRRGEHMPAVSKEYLRLWKQARIGVFEVGRVDRDTVELTEWDPIENEPIADPCRAWTLNMGGAKKGYHKSTGHLTVTYVAPCNLRENLVFGMGYGFTVPKWKAPLLTHYLAFRDAETAARPLPWKASHAAGRRYLREWKQRDWQAWLRHRLEFPFRAVTDAPDRTPRLETVTGLVPASRDEAEHYGSYLEISDENEMRCTGATAVMPVDVASPNWPPLAEYRAYRDEVGPPPGTVGQAPFQRIR